ncbi:hypothetical protein CkaCkLH20_06930 [Colletotrichum karsti]|uniref:Uncharacterized protein n=1 Tax=Colletotrichum karsti TaxID=1095194 RepID=A0A9P6LGT0_9PEZI|nr:uncharacterized protein CkaCkLH20_06930 [Colletotrichum karsti]KAF9875549.1 hypothetical protein CkaCkLH20_06930 [Colletotrichum karsti]
MSGLEPLAALGLACNILQIVEVGRQTIQLAKVVYDNRSLDPTLEDRTSSLQKISTDIKNVNVPQRWPELQRVVDVCFAAARELQEKVDFLLRNAKPGSRLSAMKIAAKANRHKGRLDSLRKKLDDAEKTMQTGLLASLW